MNAPKFKLDQWVFDLWEIDCIKIWGVRYKQGDGVQSNSGWYYYCRDKEYYEDRLTDSYEELEKYNKDKLNRELKSALLIKKESEK